MIFHSSYETDIQVTIQLLDNLKKLETEEKKEFVETKIKEGWKRIHLYYSRFRFFSEDERKDGTTFLFAPNVDIGEYKYCVNGNSSRAQMFLALVESVKDSEVYILDGTV